MNQMTFLEPIDMSRKAARSVALEAAKQRGELGMQRVADKAGSDWCEAACEAVRKYAASQHAVFTVELMRMVVERDLPAVSDKRAWGVVTRQAMARGYIEHVKGQFFPAASSNGALKAVYRACRALA